ncbi:CLN3_protein [Hexamita inflata]|uniref:CLN3 protein n=2 Tax=Hexamita inflata TaxID=28002 RepID=A0AA86Q069_9EUKA|nr:CLN3 protein [Hexamita inflata]CAI9958928.1 CLN3 protein [Hexamita inflata]
MMLSAAKDMMGDRAPTSTVLLCDILPSFIVKLGFPFIVDKIPQLINILMISILGIMGFTFAAFTRNNIVLGLAGVVINSASGGIGEVAFLAYTSKFSTQIVSAWSIGTGLAGITASGIYAILADVAGVKYETIIYIFCWLPVLMIVAHFFTDPTKSPGQNKFDEEETLVQPLSQEKKNTKQKLSSLGEVWVYMFAQFLVYISEYTINHSVNPVIEFKSNPDQYYTFANFAYQIGMFLMRCSLPVFKLPRQLVIAPAIMQFLLLVMFSFEAIYQFINIFWLMIFICFIEGLIGGLTNVSALYWISKMSDQSNREFRMGISTLFGTSGVLISSVAGMWYEQLLKSLRRV